MKGRTWQGQDGVSRRRRDADGWHCRRCHRRQRGRNPADRGGQAFCSSQGLPVKKVDLRLQDVNKGDGTTGTLKQNGSAGVTSSGSLCFQCETTREKKVKNKIKKGAEGDFDPTRDDSKSSMSPSKESVSSGRVCQRFRLCGHFKRSSVSVPKDQVKFPPGLMVSSNFGKSNFFFLA